MSVRVSTGSIKQIARVLAVPASTALLPTLVSLNFTLGDTAGGGLAIVATGTNLLGATNVRIGGIDVAPSASTSTTCTFVLPAHAAGTVADVAVTTPGGVSNALSFEFWTPAQIAGIDAYFDSNKGVTQAAGLVSQWVDQANARTLIQSVDANKPVRTAGVFGSLPSIKFTPQQWVSKAAVTILATGLSCFAVAKWNSVDVSSSGVWNAPLCLVWNDTGGIANGMWGANAGQLEYVQFVAAYDHVSRGAGLNDNVARLAGWTHATDGTLKGYVGTAQQGANATETYDTSFNGYNVVGAGFNDADGFDGDVAAVVIVSGVISGADLTKLNAWSQQRWGTP